MLCILSMMSVHVWPGATAVLLTDGPWHWLYQGAIEYLGRGSVPLLSVVSGVLLTLSAAKCSARELLTQRVRTLLLPMVAWSVLLLTLFVTHAVLTGDGSRLPTDPVGWVNAVFAITAEPVNVPLAFLRDLFVCAGLGLIAIRVSRRTFIGALAMLAAIAAAEHISGGLLLLRPQILTFFSLGVLLALKGHAGYVPSVPLVVGVLAIDILVHLKLHGTIVGGVNRVAMLLLLWRTAIALVRYPSALTAGVRKLEHYIFAIFCSHMITVTAVAAVGHSFDLRTTDPVFPVVWLAQFAVIIAVGMAVSAAGNRSPAIHALVGGRR